MLHTYLRVFYHILAKGYILKLAKLNDPQCLIFLPDNTMVGTAMKDKFKRFNTVFPKRI